MTIINPNSIAGITSVTAEAGVMNFYKSDGTLAGLQLNGVNFNTTSGISTFNNVYVGGTITYEDVKNVDSVGIITARAGITLTGGVIKHTGQLKLIAPAGNSVRIRNHDDSDNVAVFNIDGSTHLYHDSSHKFSTVSDGIDVVGNILMMDSLTHRGDTNTKIRFPANDTISFETNGAEEVRINSDGQLILGSNPTVAADAALHIELDGTREYLRLEGDVGNSNAYLEIEAPNNRRKAIIFKSGGTRRGVIGVGDSDEATDATSLFFSASSNIAGNSPHMVITSAGKVGINETSPDSWFHVNSGSETVPARFESTGTQSRIGFKAGGTANSYNVACGAEAENFIVYTNNSERLRIKSNGNVGIGTDTMDSSGNLNITDTGSARIYMKSGNSSDCSIYFGAFDDTATGGIRYDHSDDSFRFYGYNNSERLRITSTGFVGIGTDNPVRKLHVEDDNAEIALYQSRRAAGSYVNYKVGANGAELGMIGSGAAILSGGADAGDFGIRAAGDLCISSGGHAEKLRLDSSGRVLIGTTTEGHADADDLTIAATNPGITLRSATNGAGSIFFSDATSGIAEYDGFVQFYHNDKHFRLGINNDEKLRITSGGTLVLGDSDAASASGVLHLYQASNDPYIYIQRGSGDSATTIGGIFFKNSTNALGLISVRSSDINDGSMKFSTMNAGTLGEKLIIQPSGNLDVYANTVHLYNSTDTSNTYFYAQNTGAGNAGIKMKNNQGEWTIIANDRLRFIDDDASLERFSIENDGNVKVWNGGRITILSANNNGQTSTLLKIGSQGNGTETRAIDMDGGWSTNESKSITYTHGSGATNMIAQVNVQYTNPGSRFRWGKLYHSGDSSTYTMYLKSISTTKAELGVYGYIVANSNPSTHIPLASKAIQGGTGCYVGEASGYNTAYSLLPWANGGTYISSGVYYDNSTWTHRSNDNSNCLLYFKSSGWQWYASNNGSASWNVASSVGVMNSSGEWTGGTSSDRRLKDNITNMSTSDALTKVSQLQGVSYTWKDAIQKKFGIGTYPEGTHYGFIAQDVKTVWPEAHIITQSDNESDFDEDPTHDVKADVYYGEIEGVKMEKMVPLLVEAIKELKKENDALKARVTTLESS